ncbi:hypothetical protein [Luteipulveratus flavus]|uniref:Uncharacterized protein n=1 Tax=Luteipulveratus flavus TaxID=3031728 RepID=A0ABT6C9D7_9MICO|nr:hypothetical protein [Luteipulveratus sp. YIM 133296]MDF8265505.1 hypothetical protein [Luteipulveratus sp. YIM 133296]
MTTRTTVAGLALAVALGVTACSDGDSSPGTGTTPPASGTTPLPPTAGAPTSTSGAPTSTTTGVSATAVTLSKTGGFAGVREHYASTAARGPQEVFRAATSPNVRGFAGEHRNTRIADGFVYELLIRYSDRSTVRILTDDAAPKPPEVETIIKALESPSYSTSSSS